MDNMESKLNNLPRKKLSRKADLAIKLKLYCLIWRKLISNFEWDFSFASLRPALATFLILIAVVIIPGYAYANDNITRGNFLYPVKRGLENIEINLPMPENQKVAIYEKLAERRLNEAEVLADQAGNDKPELIKDTLAEAANLKEKAEEKAKNSDIKNTIKANEIVTKSAERQTEKLSKVAQKVGIGSNDELIDSIALALDHVKTNKKEDHKFYNSFPEAEDATVTGTSTEDTGTGSSTSQKSHQTVIKKSQKKKINLSTRSEAERAITEVKENVTALKDSLTKDSYQPEEVEKLMDKLNTKINRSYQAIEENDFNKLNGLLDTTKALANNAKHFIHNENKSNNGKGKDKGQFQNSTSSNSFENADKKNGNKRNK